MPRILGIDHGTRRIGLAVSDPSGMLAFPLQVCRVDNDAGAITAVLDACARTKAERIVVGLPVNMDGTEGEAVRKVRAFVESLQRSIALPIDFWDERLSTAMAERMLVGADVRRDKRRDVRDKLAAQIILQGYLDSRQPQATDEGADERVC